MNHQRVRLGLLTAGLVIADFGAIQLSQTAQIGFIGVVLVGLAAASVGGLSSLSILWNAPELPVQRAEDCSLIEPRRLGIQSAMLLIAIVAIWTAGIAATVRDLEDILDWSEIFYEETRNLVSSGPIWLPAVVLAYAVGRRRLTWRLAVVLALLEFAMVAAALWGLPYFDF